VLPDPRDHPVQAVALPDAAAGGPAVRAEPLLDAGGGAGRVAGGVHAVRDAHAGGPRRARVRGEAGRRGEGRADGGVGRGVQGADGPVLRDGRRVRRWQPRGRGRPRAHRQGALRPRLALRRARRPGRQRTARPEVRRTAGRYDRQDAGHLHV
ncbi:MAG: hypothetical protein AVDCRST_MAG64-2774, partial [uncultured Phycisphaerae bacterium]